MDFEAEIVGIKDETHDVKTFRLETEESIEFVPGQYCLVSIKGSEEFEGVKKPFTFASPPTRDFVELTVKRVGRFTGALHLLEEGDELEIEGPKGESLNFDGSVDSDVVFIAGGLGITPFISAMRYYMDTGMDNRLYLLYSNISYRDIIFRTELNELAEDSERISVVHTLTGENVLKHWDGERGFIDREMVGRHVDSPSEKLFYICGPPGMIDAMESMLKDIGVPDERIRYESWMIPSKSP